IAFALGQLGMVRRWNRQLRTELALLTRLRMIRSRTITIVGAGCAATVLVVVVLTRFANGAAISLLLIGMIWMVMTVVYRYHRKVEEEVALPPEGSDPSQVVPSRVHALVHVPQLDRATMRALSYARATRPQVLEAVTVDVDPERTAELQREWTRRGIPVTLRVIESPYREAVRPITEYVLRLRRDRPRDVVVVYMAEYVADSRWVRVVRDRAEDRLKDELLHTP